MKPFKVLFLVTALLLAQGCNSIADNGSVAAPGQVAFGMASKSKPGIWRKSDDTGEVIVRFVDSADRQKIDGAVSSINGVIVKEVSIKRNTYLIKIPGNMPVQEAITELGRKKEVVYAEPNQIYNLMEGK